MLCALDVYRGVSTGQMEGREEDGLVCVESQRWVRQRMAESGPIPEEA